MHTRSFPPLRSPKHNKQLKAQRSVTAMLFNRTKVTNFIRQY